MGIFDSFMGTGAYATPSLDGLQMGGGMGMSNGLGQSTQGMTMGQGFALPASKPVDYMALLSMGQGMVGGEAEQAPMYAPMPQMAAPQGGQGGPVLLPYQGVQYQPQATAGRFNSLLGGVYGTT